MVFFHSPSNVGVPDREKAVMLTVAEEGVLEQLRRFPFFTYVPTQPKEQLIDRYRENDIFVMPSFSETFGLVYGEAMSQGLPVIYTAGEGFSGQFPEGEAGYGVDPRDTDDLVEKILLVVKNYRELHRRCPGLARRFDWDKIIAQYERIYEDIVSAYKHGTEKMP